MNLRDRPDPPVYKAPTEDINGMTVEQFRAVPFREAWNRQIKDFDCLIILPAPDGEELHDSRYRLLDFVACKDNRPLCRLSGCSDILHINGIGGLGRNWAGTGQGVPSKVDPLSWSIDCLPESGLLRLWCNRPLIAGESLSSFEIFTGEKRK
jgi:hypothetical protein